MCVTKANIVSCALHRNPFPYLKMLSRTKDRTHCSRSTKVKYEHA